MNSYYNDDLVQRFLILWMMALLVVYGNNATLVGDDIGALRTTLGAFMVARFTTMIGYLILSTASFQHRPQARILSGLIFLGLIIWTPLFFESVSIRAKIAVAVVAITWQEVSWVVSSELISTIVGVLKILVRIWALDQAPSQIRVFLGRRYQP